jgi:hypothetical protein
MVSLCRKNGKASAPSRGESLQDYSPCWRLAQPLDSHLTRTSNCTLQLMRI